MEEKLKCDHVAVVLFLMLYEVVLALANEMKVKTVDALSKVRTTPLH